MKVAGHSLRVDWTISVGHIGSVVVFLLGGIAAYYDLKSEVIKQRTETVAKFAEYDRLWALQKQTDDAQDQRQIRTFNILTDQIRDSKNDLRGDIRDLRNDLLRKR